MSFLPYHPLLICEHFTVKKKYSLIYFSLDGIVNSHKNLAKNGKDAVFVNSPIDQHEPRCHCGLDLCVWLTVSPSNFEHYPILGKHYLQQLFHLLIVVINALFILMNSWVIYRWEIRSSFDVHCRYSITNWYRNSKLCRRSMCSWKMHQIFE